MGQGHRAHPSSLGCSVSGSTCHSQLSGKRLREVMSSSDKKLSSASPGGGSIPLDHGLRAPAPGRSRYHPSITLVLAKHRLGITQLSPKIHPSIAHG